MIWNRWNQSSVQCSLELKSQSEEVSVEERKWGRIRNHLPAETGLGVIRKGIWNGDTMCGTLSG